METLAHKVGANIDLDRLKKYSEFVTDHEFGHNMQWRSWNYGGITEPGATFLHTLVRLVRWDIQYTNTALLLRSGGVVEIVKQVADINVWWFQNIHPGLICQ